VHHGSVAWHGMDLTPRQTVLIVAVPLALFVVVTWGLAPAVNFIARHSSSSGNYRQYGFSGTWLIGLVAAIVSLVVMGTVFRRTGGR